jgi:hypothetical protein
VTGAVALVKSKAPACQVSHTGVDVRSHYGTG